MSSSDYIRIYVDTVPHEDKENMRKEIERKTAEFLANGGEIKQIPFGMQTEQMEKFSRLELINHHKQKTRAIRGK